MKNFFSRINMASYNFDFKDTICLYILVFLAGSLAGFIYEEMFTLLFDHVLIKRGFLYGPYLPVYGFGSVLLVFTLKRFKKNPLVVFFLAMLVTGVLEYFTGYFLWEIYHKNWWDYSGLFLNINGYVCLRSILTFGIGGLLLIYIVEPLISLFISKISKYKIYILSYCVCVIFMFDLILTLLFKNKI